MQYMQVILAVTANAQGSKSNSQMSSRPPPSHVKRTHSPTFEQPDMPTSKTNNVELHRDAASKPSSMPSIGMFSTKSPRPPSRRSVIKPLPITEFTHVPGAEIDGDTEDLNLCLSILLEVMQGPSDNHAALRTVIAHRSSPESLFSTHERVNKASISATDRACMIKALQAFKHGDNATLMALKPSSRQSHATSTTPKNTHEDIITQRNQEVFSHITAAYNQGFQAGVNATKELKQQEGDQGLEDAYDQGFAAGIIAAKRVQDQGTRIENAAK